MTKLSKELKIASLRRQIEDMQRIIQEQKAQENHRMVRILTGDLNELVKQLEVEEAY